MTDRAFLDHLAFMIENERIARRRIELGGICLAHDPPEEFAGWDGWRAHQDRCRAPLPEEMPMRVKRPKACAVEGCERQARARGWCAGHYSRWKRHGEPGAAEIEPRRSGDRAAFRADPTDPRHGSPNGYKNLGCHCDRCTGANTAAAADYVARRRGENREKT